MHVEPASKSRRFGISYRQFVVNRNCQMQNATSFDNSKLRSRSPSSTIALSRLTQFTIARSVVCMIWGPCFSAKDLRTS